MQLISKIMGDPNKKDLKAIQPIIDKINALEPDIKKLTDEQLAAKTAEFRAQLALYLKGGLVLEKELVKLLREALEAIEPLAAKCTNAQLREDISDRRKVTETRRSPEKMLSVKMYYTLGG